MNALTTVRPAITVAPLRDFIARFSTLLDDYDDERIILATGAGYLQKLISTDDWLTDDFARPHPDRYQQYLLHCDSLERFSVVSFVWGIGQSTPVHDHRVWGLVGVLRGAELSERYERTSDGLLQPVGKAQRLEVGQVDVVSPRVGDIHKVSNALGDQVSISIHVYGANIGAVSRATYTEDGTEKPFISGYANDRLPNLWDRSKDI